MEVSGASGPLSSQSLAVVAVFLLLSRSVFLLTVFRPLPLPSAFIFYLTYLPCLLRYGIDSITSHCAVTAMEFVDSGREPHLDQPLEALTSGTGDQPATGQNSTTAESHDMNLDALSRRAAKRRTKTGCLSMRISNFKNLMAANFNSMSKTPY